MNSEYIKISPTEKVYGAKNLLTTQLNILNIHKDIREYRKLRNEEFALKVSLKSKLNEAFSTLEILDKLLPKIRIDEKTEEIKEKHPEDLSIEQQSSLIREKLKRLQNSQT